MTSASRTVEQDRRSPGQVLVSPQWLATRLNDPGLRVIEVDVSPTAYNSSHIEGATFWNVYRDLKDTQYRTVDRRAIEMLLGRSGIDPGLTVVFYGYAPPEGWRFSDSRGRCDLLDRKCFHIGAFS